MKIETILPLEGKIKTRQTVVGPEWATKILDSCKNDPYYKNRPLSEQHVNALAADMRSGNFSPNPNPISFDEEGTLIDGQHRLWAIVMSGASVMVTISEGWPKSFDTNAGTLYTIDNIDTGRKRNVGAQLSLSHGVRGGTHWAAALRHIMIIVSGHSHLRLSTPGHLLVKEIYGDSMDEIFKMTKFISDRKAHIIAPITMFHAVNPDLATTFSKSFFSKENLNAESNELALIRWLDRNAGLNRGNLSQRMQLAEGVCVCLLAHSEGRTIGRISTDGRGRNWLVNLQSQSSLRKIREFLAGMKAPKLQADPQE